MFKPSVARANSVIMLHPRTPLTVAEVRRLSGEEHYTTSLHALETLEKDGHAVRSGRVDKVAFEPNLADPYLPAARTAAIIALPWADCLREAGVDLYAVTAIWAYGSVPRGQARPNSDLDILVIAPPSLAVAISNAFESIERTIGRTVDAAVFSLDDALARVEQGDRYIDNVFAGIRVWGEDLPR